MAEDNTDDSTLIDDCNARSEKLSDWEEEFIESISKRLRSGGSLTEKQRETLEKVWEKVTK